MDEIVLPDIDTTTIPATFVRRTSDEGMRSLIWQEGAIIGRGRPCIDGAVGGLDEVMDHLAVI